MFDKLKSLDVDLLIFLNNLGSEQFDFLWLIITNKFTWIPFYILLIYLYLNSKKLKIRSIFLFFFVVGLLILFTDQSSNLSKQFFQVLRPCNNESISGLIRIVKEGCGGLYGFFSAHAANSFAIATFFYFILNNYNRIGKFFFVWATVVSYSRVYCGVHFPSDIVIGGAYGLIAGYLAYIFYENLIKNHSFFSKSE
ncbi:MAG: phosphatase PAP2 family protein [Cryomorphaceae bacterium]|nr:MAG: phosphatase PAP2 family protein [Cryomorphaceae bacterium]